MEAILKPKTELQHTLPFEHFNLLIQLAYPELAPETDTHTDIGLAIFYGKLQRARHISRRRPSIRERESGNKLTLAAICAGKVISQLQKKFSKALGTEGISYLDEVKTALYHPTWESISLAIHKTLFVLRECGIIV